MKEILKKVIVETGKSVDVAEKESQYLENLYKSADDTFFYTQSMINAYVSYLCVPYLKLNDRVYFINGMGIAGLYIDSLKYDYIFAYDVLTLEEKKGFVNYQLEKSILEGKTKIKSRDVYFYKQGAELYQELNFEADNFYKKRK